MDYKNYNKIDNESEDNVIYKKKYKKLKRLVKDLVFENAALCDQVAQTQENLVIVKEERLYLLKKLTQFQGEFSDGPPPGKTNNLNASMSCEGVTKKSKKRNSIDTGETSKFFFTIFNSRRHKN
ncbi:transforming growth factor beta regulator 1-like [Cotesia typhae]|uniref:transforming growth factor beta regulator 1-like n=1 Tax=Cotesia typhae TaxID=2053667 RepID=UPI003D68328B